MEFQASRFEGVWCIEPTPIEDERGFFARVYCQREFEGRGLNACWPQWNVSHNKRRGTLRGLHYQAPPRPETKLVQCVAGRIFDVVVDVRRESAAFGQWEGFELSAENRRMLYVPEGFAHGFQCLTDSAEVLYHMSEFYCAELARGVRWDDPHIGVTWPIPAPILSPRDAALPLLDEQ